MATESYTVDVPWRIDEGAELTLRIHDERLIRSKQHFIRFDLYPRFAPSHPERHTGCWDLFLDRVTRKEVCLCFRDGQLCVKGNWRRIQSRTVCNGKKDLFGHQVLHVSLWDCGQGRESQREIKSCNCVIASPENILPQAFLTIPITQKCNLSCPVCPREAAGNLENVDASREVVDPLLEALPHFLQAYLGTFGEPFLSKSLIRIATDAKRRMPPEGLIALSTNATVLHDDNVRKLIDSGINSITFSVDGATKPIYEAARPGAVFEDVIRNIANAVRCGNASGRKDLWFSAHYVITKHNVHEVPEFIRLAHSLGVNSVRFSHTRTYPSQRVQPLDEMVLKPLLDQATEIGNRCGITVYTPRLRRFKNCRCMFLQSMYVKFNGDVVPCCAMHSVGYDGGIRIFGNVKRSSPIDIWNSAEFRDFRQRVLTGDLPDECVDCVFGYGLAEN